MKKLSTLLLAVILIAGCKKASTDPDSGTTPTGNDGKYLTKVNYYTPSTGKEQTIYEIALDASGNLSSLKTYFTNGTAQYELTTLDKDASGRIIKISGVDRSQSNKAIIYQFEYDANGNITKYTNTQGTVVSIYNLYTYDSSNRILTVEERNGANTQTNTLHTFTYTGTSGSPATEKEEIKNSFPLTTNNYTMEFDTKVNPSQAAPKILYYMGFLDFYKNNMTKRTDGSFTINYTFEYNSNSVATYKKASTDAGLKYFYAQ